MVVEVVDLHGTSTGIDIMFAGFGHQTNYVE